MDAGADADPRTPAKFPIAAPREAEKNRNPARALRRRVFDFRSSLRISRSFAACNAPSVRNRTSASISVKMMPVKAMRRLSICIRSFAKADLAPALLWATSMPRVDNAKKVALGVRKHHEILTLFALSEDGRPEFQQPFDFAVGIVRVEIEVQDVPVRLHAVEGHRSEERRVGKECRSRWSPY